MTEPGRRTDAESETPPRMPRWVRMTLIVVGVLVVLFVALRLTGVGGEHGPGRHLSGLGAPSVAVAVLAPPMAWTR
ncbi:hypothetical protein [Geodermatophilus maliterrae]|uniref:Uncharacterized protein n=1 Tax=Geodermatophilus maliterrae TaxID=3162531 RepID=A0ABV3XA15_9ACTN